MVGLIQSPITIKVVPYKNWVRRRYGCSVKDLKLKMKKENKIKKRFFVWIRHNLDFKENEFPWKFKSQDTILNQWFNIQKMVVSALKSDGKTGVFELGIGSEWEQQCKT